WSRPPRAGPRRSRATGVMGRVPDADAVRVAGPVRRPGRRHGGDPDSDAPVQPPGGHERPTRRLSGGGRASRGAEAARPARAGQGGPGGDCGHSRRGAGSSTGVDEGGAILREIRDHGGTAPAGGAVSGGDRLHAAGASGRRLITNLVEYGVELRLTWEFPWQTVQDL